MATFRTDDYARWGAGKGSNLSALDFDNNTWEFVSAIADLIANPPSVNQIASFSIVGTNLFVNMMDGTVIGPLPIPILKFGWRGEWAPATGYVELDVFSVAAVGIFLVLHDHTSDATFDPAAEDGGNPRYYQMFGATGTDTFAGLSDVSLTDLKTGDIVRYNTVSTHWENVRQKYVIGANWNGVMGANQDLLHHKLPVGITIPSNFADYLEYSSEAGAMIAATADTTINVDYAGLGSPNVFTNFGSILIPAAGITATVFTTVGGGAVNLLKGNVIRIRGPAVPDATLAGFVCTLVGFET